MIEFAQSLDAEEFLAALLICLGGGAVAFVATFVYLIRARTMENTPTARVRSAPQGYVELEGQARLMEGEPIVAPLRGLRCCWWRYKVEEKRRSADGKRTSWVTVDQDTSDALFHLADDTGECVVDPHGACVIPGATDVWYGDSVRPSNTPKVGAGWWRGSFSRYRYTEERIEINAPVYALGLFRTQNAVQGAAANDADVRDLLVKWKRDPKMMKLIDVNADGRVDDQEWEAARRMARQKANQEALAQPLPPDVSVLSDPKDRRPFILSGVPQEKLIRRYKLSGAGCLALALVLGGLGVALMEGRGVI